MSSASSAIRTSTRLAVWFRDSLTCVYCGGTAPAIRLTLDHLDGRSNSPTNLVTACLSCNSSRGRRSVSTFCTAKGFHKGTVWKRIRAQTGKPIEPYRHAVLLLLDRGVPDWLTAIRRGHLGPVGSAPTDDPDLADDVPF